MLFAVVASGYIVAAVGARPAARAAAAPVRRGTTAPVQPWAGKVPINIIILLTRILLWVLLK